MKIAFTAQGFVILLWDGLATYFKLCLLTQRFLPDSEWKRVFCDLLTYPSALI